ncbi:MAG: hypothetical protein R3326_08085 [Gemmatimonadota bacterium]|nr:hypothetical protein [Gemmatimonadota bacterium]
MEDLLFERLDRMDAEVEPMIVLQDLYFMDRVVRPIDGPTEPDYRGPWLVEALQGRGFCPTVEACWEAIELYDDLLDLCDIHSYAALAAVLDRYRAYHASGGAAAVEDH